MSARPVDTLLAILASSIPGEVPAIPDLKDTHWSAVMELASRTKTELLLRKGLDAIADSLPPKVNQRLSELQSLCFHKSMASVASNLRVSRLLETHGIETLSLKGVLRSHKVYGRWDVRFAADIDLLVRHCDYRSAGEVLVKNGYWAPIPSDSAWWHNYLGESPFLPDTAIGPTIDLHHKLQQPGTPAFTDTEALFRTSVAQRFGDMELRTIEPRASLLLAATSFGKALRQHEPCLTNLHEIAFVRASQPEMTDDALDDLAKEHKVLRLWQQAKATADAIFRPSIEKSDLSVANLVIKDLVRADQAQPLLHRTRLLWRWTDGEAFRPFRFARELGRVRASMISHSNYEKNARLAVN